MENAVENRIVIVRSPAHSLSLCVYVCIRMNDETKTEMSHKEYFECCYLRFMLNHKWFLRQSQTLNACPWSFAFYVFRSYNDNSQRQCQYWVLMSVSDLTYIGIDGIIQCASQSQPPTLTHTHAHTHPLKWQTFNLYWLPNILCSN